MNSVQAVSWYGDMMVQRRIQKTMMPMATAKGPKLGLNRRRNRLTA
jgi:hypothetical protein